MNGYALSVMVQAYDPSIEKARQEEPKSEVSLDYIWEKYLCFITIHDRLI